MSKKIKIPLVNKRSALHDLFHEHLEDEYNYEMELYDSYYEELYGEHIDYDCIWPPTKETRNGKKKIMDIFEEFWEEGDRAAKGVRKKVKGKNAVIDVKGDEYECDGIDDGKEIWFYWDYADKGSRIEFTSMSEFNEFCDNEGYQVDFDIAMSIMYRRISHVCLDPSLREDGIMKVIAEESYGDMVYAAVPVQELSQ